MMVVAAMVMDNIRRQRRGGGRGRHVRDGWNGVVMNICGEWSSGRSCSVGRKGKTWWWWWGALVALGEEAKSVDLVDEVGHASPTPEPESHHQHPTHHKCVDRVRANPPPDKPRRWLHCVLHSATKDVLVSSNN